MGPGSGTSLIRFERENASLRNCQDASGWRSGRLLTRGAAERFAFELSRCSGRAVPACERVRPDHSRDERVEIKEILKMMVSGTAKSGKKKKYNGDAPERIFFGN